VIARPGSTPLLTPTSSLLSAYAKRGERLRLEAESVGTEEDFRLWRARKVSWGTEAVEALSGDVDGETLSDIKRAVRAATGEGSIHEDLPVELEGLRQGLAALDGLAAQLAKRS